MGLHQRHTHGRVFRGLEAREQLLIHKRDSHGSNPVMHVPSGFDQENADTSGNQQVVSVVYVTLPQTFSGAAVYSTLSTDPNATPAPAETQATRTPTAEPTHSTQAKAASTLSTSRATTSLDKASTTAAMTDLTTATAASSSYGINQVAGSDNGATMIAGSPIRATSTPTSQAISQSSNGSGMSSGAQAGLAFGIIAGIALVAGLLFFCWRRRKNVSAEEEAKMQSEKHGSFADAGARQFEAGAKRGSTMTEKVPSSLRSTRTASTAPRLSLRPVTQFLPNLGENRKSNGNSLDVAAAGLSEKPKSAWERRPQQGQANPFDDTPAFSEKQNRSLSPHANPFDEPEGKKSSDSQVSATTATTANGNGPNSSWEGSQPATPRSTQFAATGPGMMGAGGPPSRGPNNVHRVQLDFKPSMDDELELRSGQLVRMLHEYDDGWALCIRMDRSQQGVAPRTCLSKLPVKPRPQGPQGPPPQSRPGTAQSSRRPSNPPRPLQSPNGPMYPRPLTPTQANRSPSPTEANGEAVTSPVGSVPQRKPVPGQAM